ncbi:MAG: DUF2177 family protein [Salaquimonas sp.]
MPLSITAYIATVLIFLAIDFVWLKYVALTFYRENLGDLMLEQPKLGIAAGFYLIYAAAIVVLAVMPALRANDWSVALLYGAMLGLAAYGTYDITNLATLKNWPAIVSIVDMIWGTVLTGTVATLAFLTTRWLTS